MKTWNKAFLTGVIVLAGIATNGIARAKGKGHRPQRGGEADTPPPCAGILYGRAIFPSDSATGASREMNRREWR
jgi:hypothetical protein